MRAAIVVLTLLAPFPLLATVFWVTDLEWHDQQRVLQLLVLMGVLATIAMAPASVALLMAKVRCHMRGAMLLFAVGLLSTGGAAYPAWALLEWSLLAALALLLLAVASAASVLPSGAIVAAAVGLAGFSCLYAVKTLAALGAVYTGMAPLDTVVLLDGFSNRRFLGQALTLVWPVLVGLAVLAGNRGRRAAARLFFVAASLAVYLALISQTRGTLWACLVAVIALAVVAHAGNTLWRTMGLTIVTGILVYAGLIYAPSALFGWHGVEIHFDDVGLSGRDALWAAAIQQISAHPLLGMGPMGFAGLYQVNGAHPHNSALQIAAEWGWLAALLLAALIISAWWRFAALLRRCPENAMGSALFLALTASLIQSLVDGVFVMPLSQMLLVSIAGASLAWCQMQAPLTAPRVTIKPMWVRIAALMVLLSLCAALRWTAMLPVNGYTHPDQCFSNTPRFWACGAIRPR